jgi:glycosyltransferase involved in cell wall biosynthesis
MTDTPKISVLIAVHDAQAYLREALDSVFAQTFGDFEAIVVDDGSIDATADILRGYADRRLRIVALARNAGHTTALNAGLRLCRGTYVARMDGDDVCHPERFARQAAFLDAHPATGIVGSAVWIVDGAGRRIDYAPQPLSDGAIRFVAMTRNPFHHPSVMWRAAAISGRGLAFDERYQANQDFDLWTRALPATRSANLRVPLLAYRVHGTNVSVRRSQEQRRLSLEFCGRMQSAVLGAVACEGARLANVFAALYNAPLDGGPAPDVDAFARPGDFCLAGCGERNQGLVRPSRAWRRRGAGQARARAERFAGLAR